MAKPFIDVSTGKEYDTLPEGTVRLGKLDDGTYIIKYNGEFLRVSPNDPRVPKMYSENSTREQLLSKFETREGTLAAADALVRRTAFTDENTLPFWLHAISPSLLIGAIIDGFQDGSYLSYVSSLTRGNSGIFTDDYAARHPVVSTVGNVGFDVVTPAGLTKLYTWGTTPRIVGQGASKLAWTTPFSRKVTYIGGDPEYIASLSSIEGALPVKYAGLTLDGLAVHTAPKVVMTKNPGRKLFLKMVDKGHFFPTMMEGDTQVALVNPASQTILTDLEYGFDPFRFKRFLVDPEVLTTSEYGAMMGYKRGGKLIPKLKI